MEKKINIAVTGSNELSAPFQEASTHVQNLKEHTEHSSHSLHQFSGAARLASRDLGHFVHGFALGPIGAFAVGILALREILHAQAEAAEEAAKRMEHIADANKHFKETMEDFRMEQEGKELTPAGHQMKRLTDLKEHLEKERTEQKADFVDEFAAKSLPDMPLPFFNDEKLARLRELNAQDKQVDNAMESLKGKPTEMYKAPGAGGGAASGSAGIQMMHDTLKRIESNTGGSENPNSHFK